VIQQTLLSQILRKITRAHRAAVVLSTPLPTGSLWRNDQGRESLIVVKSKER
jgi:hypothetical protein